MMCDGCGSLFDRVWCWCPDCGRARQGPGYAIDLTAPDELAEVNRHQTSAGPERYPTEWALTA